VSGNVCQCTRSRETCDGTDNDCDGIVDNEPLVDQQCATDQGSRFACVLGRCVGDACTSTDDCLAGQTCNPTTRACETISDAGPLDAGPTDGGPVDSGPMDAGPLDAGPIDAGPLDAGPIDAGPSNVDGGCRLEGASSLNLGTVGIGLQGQSAYTLSNTGTGQCTFPQAPTITSGASSIFSIVSSPSTPIPAGGSDVITVGYSPQDSTADTGQMRVTFGNTPQGTSTFNVSLQGTPTGNPACQLRVTPSSTSAPLDLPFGDVLVMTEKLLPVTFENIGSSACTIQNARFVTDVGQVTTNFRVAQVATSPLGPGASTTLQVGFRPTAETTYGGSAFFAGIYLLVDTSDTTNISGASCTTNSFPPVTGGAGCVGFSVSGTGVASHLRTVPERLDFSPTALNCNSADQTIRVYNTGTASVSLTSFSFSPGASAFSIAPSLPLTISSAGFAVLTIHFRPSASGTTSTHLSIAYSDNGTAGLRTSVFLTGTTASGAHQTDVFSQSAQPETDVLFIVDDSASMAEEQGLLANSVSAFLSTADTMQSDYHVAVVTTDMDDSTRSGNFQGSPKVITRGTGAASQLASRIRALGSNGSGIEQGLGAMYAALSDPLINDAQANGGFLRPEARLAVVTVSDEDDQSPAGSDFYRDFLVHLKGAYGAPFVSFAAIVGPSNMTNAAGEPGCTTSGGNDAVTGTRYLAVQSATGGSFHSICTNNWTSVSTDLGQSLFAARNTFTLSRVPSGAVTVRVNNVAAASGDFSFDSASNAVIFNSAAIPAPGASITADYNAQCF
jgi:hypothetical protein